MEHGFNAGFFRKKPSRASPPPDTFFVSISLRNHPFMADETASEHTARNQAGAEVYDASKIQKLEGLEGVRKRPDMYIGDTNERGLHHCVFEVVDNSVDEALAGFASGITVSIHLDGSCSVEDDGRGITVDMHPVYNIPALELVLTNLHAGGKFGKGAYQVSGGLHGVGAKCVNAVSEWFEVEVSKGGQVHHMKFERGKTVIRLNATVLFSLTWNSKPSSVSRFPITVPMS
jgi:DNA gyrase subunit B